MRDRTLKKDLDTLRAKKKSAEEKDVYLITCEHIIFGNQQDRIKTVALIRDKVHPKDSGKTILCESCALIFEYQSIQGNSKGFQVVSEREFERFYIKNTLNQTGSIIR